MRSRQDDAEDEDGNMITYCKVSFSILLLPEPTQRTWKYLTHMIVNSSPNTLRAISENVELRIYTAADVKCVMILSQQTLAILGAPILVSHL